MSKPANDTIFALSSGRGPSAVAVIRISGPMAETALQSVTGRERTPEPRQAAFARIRHPQTGEPIDEALALWFPGPRSETGEDVVELQLHGGRAVVAAMLAALSAIDGLRPAEAGEFTRRAFENGKLDLTAVEGLADLVMAETEAQRRQALRQMKGLLGGRAEEWRRKLIEALALVEAGIDFSDEGDVPKNLTEPARETARALASEIAGALADSRRGERLREGMVVAIAGPPNAGKSTLLNRIARREAAIVSPYAGTTRDVIEVHLDLDGYPVTLLDTAGIRETDDPVELEGVRRARERAGAADLVLWVTDASEPTAAGVGDAAQSGAGSSGEARTRGATELGGDEVAETAGSVGAEGFREGGGGGSRGADGVREGGPVHGVRSASPGRDAMGRPADAEAPDAGKERGAGAAVADAGRRRIDGIAGRADEPPDAGKESPVTARHSLARPPVWLVRNKIDVLPKGSGRSEFEVSSNGNREWRFIPINILTALDNESLKQRNESLAQTYEHKFNISAVTGEGLDSLFAALAGQAARWLGGEPALITRERQRRALETVRSALVRAAGPELRRRDDLIAEELRTAARALGRLTGRVDVEDILDVIFRDFCVGK